MEYLKKLHIAATEYAYIQYIGIIAAAVADTVSYLDFLLNNRYYLYIIPICILVVVYMKSQNICLIITNAIYHISTSAAICVIVRFCMETYSLVRIEDKHMSDMNSEMLTIIIIKILLSIIINIYERYVEINYGKTAGIAIALVSLSLTIVMIISSRIGYAYPETRHSIIMLIIALWLLSNVMTIIINMIEQNNRYSYELIMLERERETNIKVYDNIRSGQEELRNIRHDIKNRLNALRVAIADNDTTAALDYLDSMIGSVDNVKGKIYCNNLLINNILTYKLNNLDDNIQLECQADVSENIEIDMGDIGVIIGNLLDNSIKAVRDIKEGAYIHITISESIGRLIIIIENNYMRNNEKKPVSYYIDHGRGVNNVRRLVKKYGGTYKENVSENVYQTKVTIDM
jgi:histidine kinase-, DNA gyrase B-, and HSP90-like ATPase